MPFVRAGELPQIELFAGVRSAIVAGEKLMLSVLELDAGAVVPEHSHPHEQAGLVLEGTFRFRIGDEERITRPGDTFIIPPDVLHEGVVEDGPARILDIFSPPRDDYIEKYRALTGGAGPQG